MTTTNSSASTAVPLRTRVSPDAIVFDELNREIVEDEDFKQLVDSIRVAGVLDELHLHDLGGGKYFCIDGERRTRAVRQIGLQDVPAAVWPAEVSRRQIRELAVHKRVHRKEHGALEIARHLRQLRTEEALTQEEIATRTGIELYRVKEYLRLFQASEQLFAFFEKAQLSIRVCVELSRFEKECGELATRRLMATHDEDHLTVQRVIQARKSAAGGGKAGAEETDARPEKPAGKQFSDRVLKAFKQDPEGSMSQLQSVVQQLGYRLVPMKKE
jgi:ParB/RepB/Spo0J family partition protein